jgi:pre-rRNA-processing protein TSR3
MTEFLILFVIDRDSGSKLCRFGYAKRMKIGQSFNGIVLSSETNLVLSPEDHDIIEKYGIAGINCSWNRLEEIPFGTLGKPKNQRKLPFLLAANTVNYGKPYKMNTAEAIAAALYIANFPDHALALLFPFSYGIEFFEINKDAFEIYAACSSMQEILEKTQEFENYRNFCKKEKQLRKQEKESLRTTQSIGQEHNHQSNIGGYMDESWLPPATTSDDEYEEEELEENNNNNNNNHDSLLLPPPPPSSTSSKSSAVPDSNLTMNIIDEVQQLAITPL